MCGRRKKHTCCGCYPGKFTDRLDLFAEPVYQFTFRDSYYVSTICGSVCTVLLILCLVFVVGDKFQTFIDKDPNQFIVTQGVDYGYYPETTEFDSHLVAMGLIYKPEFQDQMTPDFTLVTKNIVNIQFFMREKVNGKITTSDPLVLDPCSTLDLNKFYTPRKSSSSFMTFLQTYKPMQCLDEFANLEISSTRQQSSQVIEGVATNDRVKAARGG